MFFVVGAGASESTMKCSTGARSSSFPTTCSQQVRSLQWEQEESECALPSPQRSRSFMLNVLEIDVRRRGTLLSSRSDLQQR